MHSLKLAFVIGALCFNFSAQAATINYAEMVPQQDGDTESFNISGAFGDNYEFEVLTPFAFTSSVTGLNVLDSFSTSLFSGWTSLSFLLPDDGLANPATNVYRSFINEKLLGPGKYTFSISGTALGTGNYVGNFTVGRVAAVSVVSEPETYAVFLAGLGLLAFASRRNNLL